MTEGITITLIIVSAISFWIVSARLVQERVVDNLVRRQKLFNYLNSIGLLISAKGKGKTRDVYQKAYQSFLVTMPVKAAPFVEKFNREFIDSFETLSKEEMNDKISEFYTALRKCYKIAKAPIRAYIAELNAENKT